MYFRNAANKLLKVIKDIYILITDSVLNKYSQKNTQPFKI